MTGLQGNQTGTGIGVNWLENMILMANIQIFRLVSPWDIDFFQNSGFSLIDFPIEIH